MPRVITLKDGRVERDERREAGSMLTGIATGKVEV